MGWIAKGLLALAGVVVGVFLAEGLIGGALGWAAGGAVMGICAMPLIKPFLERLRQKDERIRREKDGV